MKRTDDYNGTSRQGTVLVTFAELVKVLGAPHYTYGDKTTAEWAFLTDDGVVFTIYDYYNLSTPQNEYHWHIGGHSAVALEAVKVVFPNRTVAR